MKLGEFYRRQDQWNLEVDLRKARNCASSTEEYGTAEWRDGGCAADRANGKSDNSHVSAETLGSESSMNVAEYQMGRYKKEE